MSYKKTEYIKVYKSVMRDRRLTSNEKLLYSAFQTAGERRKGIVKVSNDYIAKTLNVTQPTLNKLLQSLEDKNLIKRHYKNGDLKQRYFEVLPYHAE